MKVKSFAINLALIQVAIVLTVMWLCLSFWMHAHAGTIYADVGDTSGKTLSTASHIGNAMPILGFPGLVTLWALANRYRKKLNEQQDQIDELKGELESMKRNE